MKNVLKEEETKEMKKTFKVVAAMLLVVVMMMSLTACGVDMSKIKGDWTLSTIGGKSIADVAAEKGIAECFLITNYTITDKEIKNDTLNPDGSGAHTSSTFTLKQRSNGVEGYLGDQLAVSLIFDEKANTLTAKLGTDESNAVEYVFTKGSRNLDEALQAAMGGSSEGDAEESYGEEESYEEE